LTSSARIWKKINIRCSHAIFNASRIFYLRK